MPSLMASGFHQDDVIVYGLGGHKCGSSWIAEYLRKHPQCFVSAQKELDAFGPRSVSHNNWRIKHRIEKIKQSIANFRQYLDADGNVDIDHFDAFGQVNVEIFDLSQNISVLTGIGHYSDVFRRRAPNEKWLVDISPAYSTLTRMQFEEMNAVHGQTRFVMSMRDPVERFFSAYRYGRSLKGKGIPRRSSWRIGQLQPLLNDHFYIGCSDYGRTLSALESAIDSDRIFTCFYENLFNDQTVSKLCAFLGIDFQPANYDRKVHETRNDDQIIKMHEPERAFLMDALSYVYKDMDARFGDQAPDSWNWPEDIAQLRQQRRLKT